MQLFSSVSLSWTKKTVRGALTSLALGAILFSSGVVNASWISDIFGGYEEEVITKDVTCFSDLKAGTLETEAACYLKSKGVIGGFPDGEFKGNRPVNRAELSKFLLLGSGKTVTALQNKGKFPDVLDGEWYVKYVMTAAKYGIISGYPDKLFRPAQSVNTAEFLKMAVESFGLEKNLDYQYADVLKDSWFAKYVGIAERMQLFPERTTKKLDPAKNLTRKDVAIAIYRILKPINEINPDPEPIEDANCFVKSGGQIVKKLHADDQRSCQKVLDYRNDIYREDNSRNADNCRYSPDMDTLKYEVEFIYKNEIFYQITCPQFYPLPPIPEGNCVVIADGQIIKRVYADNLNQCKKILSHEKSNCQSYSPKLDSYKAYRYKLNFLFKGQSFYNETCATPKPIQREKHILKVSPILNRTMEQEYLTVPFERVPFLRVGIKNTENVPVYIKNLKFQARGTEKSQNYGKYKVSLISNLAKPSNGRPTVSVGIGPKDSDKMESITINSAPPVGVNQPLDRNGIVNFNQNHGLYINGDGYLELTLIVDSKAGTAPGKISFDLIDMDAVSAPMTMEMAKEKPVSILNGQNTLSVRNPIRGRSQKLSTLFSNEKRCQAVYSLRNCQNGKCDANRDGIINEKDLTYMREYIVGLQKNCGTDSNCSCDIDANGSVSILDVIKLSRMLNSSEEKQCDSPDSENCFILGPPEKYTTQ